MTPEEKSPKVHHQTVRGARLALARKEISQGSYRAVLAGEITLARARELGRSGSPNTPGDPETVNDGPAEDRPRAGEPRPCLCSCGGTTRGGTFLPGHDARLHGVLKRNLEKDPLLRNERFNDEQRAYAVKRGLVGPEVLAEGDQDA